MPLIELKCPECGAEYEELVKADGEYPSCKKCGSKLNQKWSGKLCVSSVKKGGGCSGNCSCCKGCH